MAKGKLTSSINALELRIFRTLVMLSRRISNLALNAWQAILDVIRRSTTGNVRRNLVQDVGNVGLQTTSLLGRDLTALGVNVNLSAERLALLSLPTSQAGKVFQAPSLRKVSEIVFETGWEKRLASMSKLTDPKTMANTIINGYSQGKNIQQIAKDLLPSLNGVKSSARRVARTEGMRIAHTIQFENWEALGPAIVTGYKIHCVHDEVTRPEHLKRDQTEYFREPKGEQLGFDKMPKPPLEADGSVAFNCRCWLTPILSI